jgi:hypothetical protein
LRDVDQFNDADAESDAACAFGRRVAIVFAAVVVSSFHVPLALVAVGLTFVRQQRFRPPVAKPVAWTTAQPALRPVPKWLGVPILVAVGRRALDTVRQ